MKYDAFLNADHGSKHNGTFDTFRLALAARTCCHGCTCVPGDVLVAGQRIDIESLPDAVLNRVREPTLIEIRRAVHSAGGDSGLVRSEASPVRE